MFAHVVDHFVFTSRKISERNKWITFGVTSFAIVANFWWFRGLAFGIDGPIKEHAGLLWRKVSFYFFLNIRFIMKCLTNSLSDRLGIFTIKYTCSRVNSIFYSHLYLEKFTFLSHKTILFIPVFVIHSPTPFCKSNIIYGIRLECIVMHLSRVYYILRKSKNDTSCRTAGTRLHTGEKETPIKKKIRRWERHTPKKKRKVQDMCMCNIYRYIFYAASAAASSPVPGQSREMCLVEREKEDWLVSELF